MSFGSEFQTLEAATLNARLAVSVRVLGTNRRRALVDRSDRIISRRRSSSSRFGGTDVVCDDRGRPGYAVSSATMIVARPDDCSDVTESAWLYERSTYNTNETKEYISVNVFTELKIT